MPQCAVCDTKNTSEYQSRLLFTVNHYHNVHKIAGKSMWISRILLLFALSTFLALAEAEEVLSPSARTATLTPLAEPSAPFYLIVDYTPAVLYVGDVVTCCFRVENKTQTEANLELVAQTVDASGKELNSHTKNLTIPAQKSKALQLDLDSEKGRKISFTLRRKGETETLAQTKLCLLRDDEVWPETIVRNARMETDPGTEIFVPLVSKRRKIEDRSYAPLKWLLASSSGSDSAVPEQGIAYIPARWEMEKAARRRRLPPYKNNGVSPILMATDTILKSLRKTKSEQQKIPERIVIVLPPEDLDVGTDPQVYKLLLETLLSHLHALGVKEIILIPPVQFGAADKPLRALWKVVHETAKLYHCQSVEVSDNMKEAWWRIDATLEVGGEGVYGQKPNAEGLKKFEQGLTNLLP